ncbi:MAG: hypothetical protein Rubg2KO_38660 [Rubricoccaceae bacterium]
MRVLLILALLVAAGCAPGVTYDEAYGRPDSQDWTYFRGSTTEVVQAIEDVLAFTTTSVESVGKVPGGTVVTLSERYGGGDVEEIYIEDTTKDGFGARAQLYGRQTPLPLRFEQDISREL